MSYDKAEALLRQVLAAGPGNPEARRSLGRLLVSVANYEEQPDQGSKWRTEGMAIWQELHREDPNQEDNLRGLGSAHFATYLHLAREDSAEAIPHMERALEIFQKLLDAKPDNLDRKRNVALCHKHLAGRMARSDPARGFEDARRAAQLDAERSRSAASSGRVPDKAIPDYFETETTKLRDRALERLKRCSG